jgi:Arc/MetJ-type ribon-helix-helix transcriptional regulator
MRKITTIRLDEADRQAIATIRQRYGVASDSDAIRLALRVVAESRRVDIRQNAHAKDADNADNNGRNEPA